MAGCAEKVVDHDRPCAPKTLYEDFALDDGDPPARLDALFGVTELVGDLSLSGPIDSLEPLSCLSRVHGRLTITHSSLDSLGGLERLERVGGLSLSALSQLRDAEGLSGLGQIDDGLELSELPAVEDLSSLSGVAEIQGLVMLRDIAPSAELGLSLGERFDGELVIEHEVPALEATTGALREITGSIHVAGASIAQVDLRSLESVGGLLGLTADGAPRPMPTLGALREVAGPLRLHGLQMQDLSGLAALESVGELSIGGCEPLETLDGLEGLRAVVSGVPAEIAGNAGGGVSLYDNASLVDLRALGGITEVAGWNGVSGLLSIRNNPRLRSVEGTGPLVEHMLLVSLRELPALEDLAGWSDLSRLGGLAIDDTGLRTLDGLSLTPDAQFGPEQMQIELRDNAELVDIVPLVPQPGHAVPADGIIFVERSPALSGCQVQALIDQARDQGFDGDVVQEGLLDDSPC